MRALSAMTGGDTAAGLRLYRESLARFPEDPELRFETVRPFLASLARGAAPPGIAEIARGLAGEPRLVLDAIGAVAHQRWDDLVAMDRDLAAVSWMRPWAVDALQVRVDWRTRVATPQARRAYGDEALALLDRALVVQPTSALFWLLTLAALSADRPDAIVESISSYAQAMYATASRRPAGPQREQASRTLQGLTRVLDQTAQRAPATARRAASVRANLQESLRKLEAPR